MFTHNLLKAIVLLVNVRCAIEVCESPERCVYTKKLVGGGIAKIGKVVT